MPSARRALVIHPPSASVFGKRLDRNVIVGAAGKPWRLYQKAKFQQLVQSCLIPTTIRALHDLIIGGGLIKMGISFQASMSSGNEYRFEFALSLTALAWLVRFFY